MEPEGFVPGISDSKTHVCNQSIPCSTQDFSHLQSYQLAKLLMTMAIVKTNEANVLKITNA